MAMSEKHDAGVPLTDDVVALVAPEVPTEPSITCPACGRTSHNPNDVREGYCGNCSMFHDQMEGRR